MILEEYIKVNPLAAKWNMPTACPVCGSALEINDNHTEISCTNEACKSKLIGRLKKWCEKMEIKELAPVTLEKFIDGGLVSSVSDLYKADFNKVASWDGFGERSAEIYTKNIHSANKAKLAQFIAGYNIDDIGEKVVQKIIDAKSFKTLEEMKNAKVSDFICEGVGEVTAQKLLFGLQILYPDMVETMKFVEVEVPEDKSQLKFAGMVFCFTGAACLPRPQLQKMAEANGGKCGSSVSKNTTYLVTDDELSGSAKAKKALELGTKILRSEDFVKMCEA